MTSETTEEIMLEIQNTLVSLDLIERYFCCDLSACKGACCIEGDAGAPLTESERDTIDSLLPELRGDILPSALSRIDEEGTSYVDEEGDLVTQIVEGKNCVWTCYGEDGECLCAIERACSQGRTGGFRKPESCALYPVRLTEYPSFTAVNLHRWKICRPAEKLGRKLGLRAYEFLRGPLTARFGAEWYEELDTAARAYLAEYGDNNAPEE